MPTDIADCNHNNSGIPVESTESARSFGAIHGSVVMIGFGSIGRGVLPLLRRHFSFDEQHLTVIDPAPLAGKNVKIQGARWLQVALTPDNFEFVLYPLLTSKGPAHDSVVVNVSVDVCSLDVMKFCRKHDVIYIDTVVEPWPGLYFNASLSASERSNYALRETVADERRRNPGGSTAVSCCGANPGMVSWFVKQALMNLARDLKIDTPTPTTREEWASLMQRVGVKGIHIAERDTQRRLKLKDPSVFVNTWSVDGFVSEALQPSELGWGTHEKRFPEKGFRHSFGCQAAIGLNQPGGNTRVRSWCPTPGPQIGFLVTHNEAISIADYFTVGDPSNPEYRPTCHYAYHPCDEAVLSLLDLFGSGKLPGENQHILNENEIHDGVDELGVLLYGHARNAYWFGSQLSMEQTRRLAPHQNATSLQVTSAISAALAWALENPRQGIVEADDIDFARCLELQTPYLGNLFGQYTDWTPLQGQELFGKDVGSSEDAWQFENVLVK